MTWTSVASLKTMAFIINTSALQKQTETHQSGDWDESRDSIIISNCHEIFEVQGIRFLTNILFFCWRNKTFAICASVAIAIRWQQLALVTVAYAENLATFRYNRVTSQINLRGSAEDTTILQNFCKITPKNTHFCAFWKQILDNIVYIFFYFYGLRGWPWHSGPPLRTGVALVMTAPATTHVAPFCANVQARLNTTDISCLK